MSIERHYKRHLQVATSSPCEVCGGPLPEHDWADLDPNGYVVSCSNGECVCEYDQYEPHRRKRNINCGFHAGFDLGLTIRENLAQSLDNDTDTD